MIVPCPYGVNLLIAKGGSYSSFEEAVEARRKELVQQEKERLTREDPSLSQEEAEEKAMVFVDETEHIAQTFHITYGMVDDYYREEYAALQLRRSDAHRKNRGKRQY